jgi:amino acid adenylation domain-containing protein
MIDDHGNIVSPVAARGRVDAYTADAAPASLLGYLRASVARRPDHVAVEETGDGRITYAELDALSDAVRDRLHRLGVRRGDRVGVYLHKSIDAFAVILGVMKAGAAYVPVDPGAPAWRSAYILHDGEVRVAVLDARFLDAWTDETTKLGPMPAVLSLDGRAPDALRRALTELQETDVAPGVVTVEVGPDDLAYVLYTSGSTGRPKGVMLTHGAATGFVNWCSRTFAPREDDRFSSHAPFHFDLSILDLYLPMKHGATVLLIGAEAGKEPMGLATLIAERRLTVWYSTPTILTVLAQYGKLERHDVSALRIVFFAGEVFPVKHLRQVKRLLPGVDFYNLYGPTETNVCTYHPIPDEVPEDRDTPYPIGTVCDHLDGRVVDGQGRDVPVGEEGELCIAGDNILQGYWKLPEQTSRAFLVGDGGTRWYRTGDIVIDDGSGCLTFVGRRDRMVKRRGYRIELGEVESGLYRHPQIAEAAVVATTNADGAVVLKAFVAMRAGATPSLIELKRFCAQALPMQMIPDAFVFCDALPKTSTDKVDYQRLLAGGDA